MNIQNLLPAPKTLSATGESFVLPLTYHVTGFDSGDVRGAVRAFVDYCDRAWNVLFVSAPAEEAAIVCTCETGTPDGRYRIDAADGHVSVSAGDTTALSYAFATLLLSFEAADGGLLCPAMHIEDAPSAPWRGLMVDLARKWHPVKYLYDAVDLCWLYKLSRLQLHFTDDQSFTLPSDAFPLLPSENRTYSKEELRALAAYARERGVTLVPEVDLPGHCTRFNQTYPDIFGSHGIMCAEEKTFSALETILDETLALFPDAPYIHLGGDEAAIARWDDCPGCRAYREAHGLENVHALYAHYLQRMTDYVLSKGVTPVIWEGFSKEYNHLISKDVIVVAWESYYQLAPDLLDGGFTLINCSWKPLYIVTPNTHWTPAEILDWNIHTWRHWWPKSIASTQDIVVPENAPVLGGQICAWGDGLVSLPSNENACQAESTLIRERIPALAEKTWNTDSSMTGEDLAKRFAHTDAVAGKLLRK